MIYPDEERMKDSCFKAWCNMVDKNTGERIPIWRMWDFFKFGLTVEQMKEVLNRPEGERKLLVICR